LPKAKERRLHTPVDGSLRRVRVVDREAAASVVCLRPNDGGADATGVGVDAAKDPAGPFAAFAAGRALTVIWTDVASAEGDGLTLTARVHRSSYGSPLVSPAGVTGMVVSATTAVRGDIVAAAAAKAVRVTDAASLEGSR
jgi:hypothetical protein